MFPPKRNRSVFLATATQSNGWTRSFTYYHGRPLLSTRFGSSNHLRMFPAGSCDWQISTDLLDLPMSILFDIPRPDPLDPKHMSRSCRFIVFWHVDTRYSAWWDGRDYCQLVQVGSSFQRCWKIWMSHWWLTRSSSCTTSSQRSSMRPSTSLCTRFGREIFFLPI